MGMRRFFLSLCIVGLLSGTASVGHCATLTPEQTVRDFYAWYMENCEFPRTGLEDDAIFKFVNRCTVERLRADLERGSLPNSSDYFLKAQDPFIEEWRQHFTVHQPVAMANDITLVPVTFGKDKKTSILVYLKKTKDGFCIIKAADMFPY